jgi:dihydrodipicolinate synthase/N-acetylneuraminate lyase
LSLLGQSLSIKLRVPPHVQLKRSKWLGLFNLELGTEFMTKPEYFPSPPEGLIIDLVTPLTGAGTLDRAGVDRLAGRALPAADALLAGSPLAGEALDLPVEIRKELFAHLLPLVGGMAPLILGITGHSPEETRDLALWVLEEARRRRYSGPLFLADLPLWYHSNRGLPQGLKALLAEAQLPLILLNLPQVVRRRGARFKHLNIRTHVFKKAAGLPEIRGLIFQGEMRRFLHYHHAAAARPGFAFYETDEERFLTRPGAWGVVSGGAQLLPGAWRRVARACLHPEEGAEDPQGRYELWELSNRLRQVHQLSRGNPVALWKKALAAQGVLAGGAAGMDQELAPGVAADKLLDLLAGFAD